MNDDLVTDRLMPPPAAFDPEAYVGELAEHWTGPHPAECLYCYLCRVLDEFGCRGSHEWTQRWCDAQSFGTGWVVPWVQRNGGCCCDCEVVMNVWSGGRSSQRHRQLQCAQQGCRDGRGGR